MTKHNWNIQLQNSPAGSGELVKKNSKQIAVLMSGGVDSSVTAYLLKKQGWDVLGITMIIPVSCGGGGDRACCGADAAFVCDELEMPHKLIDVIEPFNELIIDNFAKSYSKGVTPNPCVDCNTLLKFSLVWDVIREHCGVENLATGHYARISHTDTGTFLGRAKDKTKDQSYFLYGISKDKLDKIQFPLGELTKIEVREIANKLNLTVADKSESMELCFAGQGDYRAVLDCEKINLPGAILDMQGNRISTHKGIANYTLGQRQGIGYAGGKPLYVAKIDAKNNTIALGSREDISTKIIKANYVNILIPDDYIPEKQIFGKIRSYGNPQPCRLIAVDNSSMEVEFDEPIFAPCPGQRMVLYNNENNIIAGGVIIE
ncbi:MAG: tRNA 2-thiouridine(34) synthase MnmA [Sedimentisphaerales bacterium]|nr:tRNA 2-thiouridine(34) synthase MnmA [Sedimentisphaerales bacterium]